MKFRTIAPEALIASVLAQILISCSPANPVNSDLPDASPGLISRLVFPQDVTSIPQPTPTPEFIVRPTTEPNSQDPTTYTHSGTTAVTFDPAHYVGDMIQNVYETLVFYDDEKTDAFVPGLAESWEVSRDGKTWTFWIRQNVRFHNGDELTASDVAYSFHRTLLQGGDSVQWIFSEPFFGVGNKDVAWLIEPDGSLFKDEDGIKQTDPEKLRAVCEQVKSMITADDATGTVIMKLPEPWSPFLSMLPFPSLSIMDAGWVGENGGWNGSCDTWQEYYGMGILEGSPFDQVANGTGPFKLTDWKGSGEIVLERNDNYWRGPANLERIEIKAGTSDENVHRILELGLTDSITDGSDYRADIEGLVGERCEYDSSNQAYKPCEILDAAKPLVVFTGKPKFVQRYLLFNFNIPGDEANPFLGSARLDGLGIPRDFFADIHIRKAFAHCIDFDAFIQEAYTGNALPATQFLPAGMPGYDPELPGYDFDKAACEAEFKLADVDGDGVQAGEDPDDIWNVGFEFSLPYYKNYPCLELLWERLSETVNAVNSKFVIKTSKMSYSAYFDAYNARLLPLYLGGFFEDIHDPYHWFEPFIVGEFSELQSIPEETANQFKGLLQDGLKEMDLSKRLNIYSEASHLYYDQALSVPLAQPTTDYFWQRWVEGMVLNPFNATTYFYPIEKK